MPAAKSPPKVGERFGHWTVVENGKRVGRQSFRASLCRCDCGNTGIVRDTDLRLGRSKSCRCHYGVQKTPHRTANGDSKTRLYTTWMHMLTRCNDPESSEYYLYGARGIKVCDDWAADFQKFKKWAYESGYTDELTIDRIDVNGNYEPSNCRWATNLEQQNNRRNNIYLTFKGKTQSMAMWAREVGLHPSTLSWRVKHGWSVEDALTRPLRKEAETKKRGE